MKRKSYRKKKFLDYFDDCNVEVFVEDYDSLERAINKFTKKMKEGEFLEEYISRMVYEKPSDRKRRKLKDSKYRVNKERRKAEQ